MQKVAQHWWDYTLPVVKMLLHNPEPWLVTLYQLSFQPLEGACMTVRATCPSNLLHVHALMQTWTYPSMCSMDTHERECDMPFQPS
jgi:hypothetical protein